MSSSSLPYLNALTSLRNDVHGDSVAGKKAESPAPGVSVEVSAYDPDETASLQVVESAKKAILNRLQSGSLSQEDLRKLLKFPESVKDVQSMVDRAVAELQSSELVQGEDTRLELTPFARQAMGAFLI